jgi:UDP-glucose 4-epimerase
MTRAIANQGPVIFGDGSQSRDFVYVRDVVNALILAANSNNAAGAVLNIGTGNKISINRLWDLIASLTGRQLMPVYAPARAGDILHSVADINLAGSILNYRPGFSLEQGLAATLEWYRSQRTEDGRQRTDDRGQTTEGRRQRIKERR